MASHFPETFKLKIEKEINRVTLSIKVTDLKVEVYNFDLSDFRKMVGDFIIQDEQY